MPSVSVCCSVKTLGEECVILFSCRDGARFCCLNTSFFGQQMAEVLPKADVVFVISRREFRHAQFSLFVEYSCLRSGTTKRGPWVNEL